MGLTVNKGRFQGGEGGHAKKTSLREVEENRREWVDATVLQEELECLGFTPSLTNPEREKGRLIR